MPALYKQPTAIVVGNKQTSSEKIEDAIVSKILKGFRRHFRKRSEGGKNERDFEIANNLEEVEAHGSGSWVTQNTKCISITPLQFG